jgi:ubiquinone/menaquinone biosynthesis C-methylase UbiE
VGQEIDLLLNYPRAKRNVEARGQEKTEEDRLIARKFGRDFFDGDRRHGYGGFNYHPRFWQPVVPTLQQHFNLKAGDAVLDVGCGKGFMLHDLGQLISGLTLKGIDISSYAIEHAIEDMKQHVQVADAKALPFADGSFDVVVSINTIHNLAAPECALALREIQRVARRGAFVTVDAYRTPEERERMFAWNLTAQTIMSTEEWTAFFAENGYTGDYYWFIP